MTKHICSPKQNEKLLASNLHNSSVPVRTVPVSFFLGVFVLLDDVWTERSVPAPPMVRKTAALLDPHSNKLTGGPPDLVQHFPL